MGARLKAIKKLKAAEELDSTLIPELKLGTGTLSVHSFYSFSPYSPSLAAYMAYKNGVECAAISDHDTLAGAEEFIKAADILGIESAAGLQLRAKFYDGKGRWLNNFYQKDVGFIAIRGVPQQCRKALNAELEPIRRSRAERNKLMVEKLNQRISKYGITINYDKDVKRGSMYSDGGSITERHILYAFACKLMARFKSAEEITGFITEKLNISIEDEFRSALSDISNPYYAYDLVNCLKHEIRFFYVPDNDLPDARSAVELAHKYGALITYTYFGETVRIYDGEEVVFKFEDEYLDELINDLGSLGFDAIEYVPEKVPDDKENVIADLAKKNGMFTIPCTDINSPRQRFIREVGVNGEVLTRNMWAVVGHSKSAAFNIEDGLNTAKSKAKNPDIEARLKLYAEIGKLSMK